MQNQVVEVVEAEGEEGERGPQGAEVEKLLVKVLVEEVAASDRSSEQRLCLAVAVGAQ